MAANSVKISLAAIKLAIYPIGSIYTSVGTNSPATLFGGTWEAFGAGKVLVGIDSGDASFDTIGETGGAKTHALSEAELATHTHIQDSHTHPVRGAGRSDTVGVTYSTNGGGAANMTPATGTPNSDTYTGALYAAAQTATNQNTGSGTAHNNLQPYVVVYFWKRTA